MECQSLDLKKYKINIPSLIIIFFLQNRRQSNEKILEKEPDRKSEINGKWESES